MPNLSTNYNVQQVKSDLAAITRGTTINQISGINNLFGRAGRQLLLDIDPQETIVTAQTPTIYDGVFNYSISNLADLKGNRIIDVRPQVARSIRDVFGQTYEQEFDVNKGYTTVPNFTVDWNAATKSLRINAMDLITGILLNNADTVTANGTWVAGGTASNLAVDTVNSVTGSSLKFNLSAGGAGSTGYLENSTMNAVDLTTHLNLSTLFLWSYLPTASVFSNIELRWGSSASNYWAVNYTAPFNGTSFVNGWNQEGSIWTNATTVGSPNVASISYLRITWTYDGTAQTGVHLNQVQSILGQIFQILYYSKYLFRDVTTGTFQETVTGDTNLINLDTETFPIFFNLLAYYTLNQISGVDEARGENFFLQEYTRGVDRYKSIYKSQVTKPKLNYYRTPRMSNQKWMGRGWWSA